MRFRQRVLEKQDAAFDKFGDSPDHIVLSEEMYNFLDETHNFEQLQNSNKDTNTGFIGMTVWESKVLDKKDKQALLLSADALSDI